MDARLNPYPMALLGLREGDAHVIRNAGGVITDDEMRSLAISPAPARHPRIIYRVEDGRLREVSLQPAGAASV